MTKKAKRYLKQCVVCNDIFSTNSGASVYCSDECKNKWYELHGRRRTGRREIPERKCSICGGIFKPQHGNNKYCSRACSLKSLNNGQQRRTFFIFERDDFKCIYCGRSSIKDNVVLHCDHIIPRVLGGEDVARNLVTSCRVCNTSKSGRGLKIADEILDEVAKRNEIRGICPELLIYGVDSDIPI